MTSRVWNVTRVARFVDANYLIKVCAVTSPSDADLVATAGATALGIIVTESPRRVSLERAREISAEVAGRISRVAVVRHVDAEDVRRVLDTVDVDALQVHGGLRRGVAEVAGDHDVALIEALSIESLDVRSTHADAYLIDGPQPGSGRTHSWREVLARSWDRPLIVAGGLTADNVVSVLNEVGPWGCDVATGSETSPGIKDPARVQSFVLAARQYFEDREESRG